MRPLAIVRRTFGIILWVIFGILLLVTGIVLALYSPWGQDALRLKLLDKLNATEGTEVKLDKFRLKFPITLDLEGLMLVQNGDTMIAARSAYVDVALMPLLKGEVDVREAVLRRARYQMGNADSLMQMLIKADSISINPAYVKLSPLDIHLIDGTIAGGTVSMISRNDTTAAPKPTAPPSPLTIRVDHLNISDLAYTMRMLPTIDSLGATIGRGALAQGKIDLVAQTVEIGQFTGSQLNAAYIAPDSAEILANPLPVPSDSVPPTAPWTVTIDSIHFTDSQGLYTTRGMTPLPGLDFAYIQAYDMDITVNDFYNQATSLTLPIKLRATERCGLTLDANGTFAMDSTAMYFRDFHARADNTDLIANGMMGVGTLTADPSLPLRLQAEGYAGIPDLLLMFPDFKPYLTLLPANTDLRVALDLAGTAGDLNIEDLNLQINRIISLNGSGRLRDAFSAQGPTGNVKLHGRIIDVNGIVKSMIKGTALTVPPMTLDGNVDMGHGTYRGNIKATTLGGSLALNGNINLNSQGYKAHLATAKFPVQAFMKDMGVGRASVQLDANGSGFDMFSPKTVLNATANVKSVEYNGYDYGGILLNAHIKDGQANVDVQSDNKELDANIHAQGNLNGQTYDWTANVDARSIDLYALKFATDPATVASNIDAKVQLDPKTNAISANATVRTLDYVTDNAEYNISDIKMAFESTDSATNFTLTNRDLLATVNSPCSLDTIMARFADLSLLIDHQIKLREIQPDSLQQTIPPFNMYVSAGTNNFINDILAQSKMSMRRMDIAAANDSTIGLNGRILGIRSPSMRLDTIGVKIDQHNNKIQLSARLDNRPGSFDNFAHVNLNCILNTNKVAIRATQRNIQNQTGFDIGMLASFADSTVTARIFPLNPTIGYEPWKVNLDNFISYNFPAKRIDANLKMSNDKSSLAIYSDARTDSISGQTLNDIAVKISDIYLADWIAINPFAPPITGALSADLHFDWKGGQEINGSGTASLADLYYDKQRVGTFTSNIDVSTNASGMIRAKADLFVDGQNTMTIAGALNDSTAVSPFNLDFKIIHFPLAIANPFIPQGMAKLSGTLNGLMDIRGDAANPRIDGEISFDSAAVKLAMTGISYPISSVKIPVKDNVVTFTDFGISGTNENPLRLNGTVDLHSMITPKFDLKLDADNLMLVNTSSAPKGADLFGKAYVNLNASVKGSTSFMRVNADLAILSGTNVTYILSDAMSTLQSPTQSDMVKFVNFSDTLQVSQADIVNTGEMLLAIDANLVIQNGTTITVNLSSTTRDRVQVSPTANLTYTQSPISDGRLTGRIVINEGFARYTLPVIGQEKRFAFDPGSYVAFNGDILNPVLNIHATDEVKTNVTQEGQNSRLVNFDILLNVTGTLEQMDVVFDLTTNDDITIANELQSMSPEQRANQAMNLLLYNMYTGPGTKASANLTINPLYSFLESQVNNWAANNIKGVDLSFGIDQYNQTTNGTTSTAMSYSYQVSKSLFNDRFKIVVGGNYNTDENSDENLSENLINDISFVYYLNQQRTMLLKLFRHTGFESILEGEITQTGLGFVYKRKVNRLVQILPRFMRPKKFRHIEQ